MSERVYVVVDAGLSRGAQAAQAIHAVTELQMAWPAEAVQWRNNGNVIIVLESDDLSTTLYKLVQDEYGPLSQPFYGLATFREPDFNNKLTAFAVFGDAHDIPGQGVLGRIGVLLSDLPLAGRNPRWPWQERKLQRRETELRGSGVLR